MSNRSFNGSDANDIGGNPLLQLVAGTYELAVDAPGDQTGAYSFRLLDEATAEALTPGVPVSGLLDPANSTRMFRFDAEAGERFYFDMRSVANGNGSWRLLDPNGNQVWFTGIGSDVDVQTLAFTGPYTGVPPLPSTPAGDVTNTNRPRAPAAARCGYAIWAE